MCSVAFIEMRVINRTLKVPVLSSLVLNIPMEPYVYEKWRDY